MEHKTRNQIRDVADILPSYLQTHPLSKRERLELWAEALERMESELHGALAKVDPIPWRPPAGLGPIPEELQERAARLLEAQLHTIRYLEESRQAPARHLGQTRPVPEQSSPHPVFFDLLGWTP